MKSNVTGQRARPKAHVAIGAAPLRWVDGSFAVGLSTGLTTPANVLPAVNETSLDQGAPKDNLELGIRRFAHLALVIREDELRRRLCDRSPQHGNDWLGHRDDVRVTTLRRLTFVGASHQNGAVLEIQIRLAKPQQLSFSHARPNGHREQVAPGRQHLGENERKLLLTKSNVNASGHL